MKTIIIESLKKLVADRYLLVLIVAMLLLAIIASVVIGLSIHPSEIQLVSHYSVFGLTNYYRDQWLYLWVFVIFELSVAILHSIVAVKLLIIKGHSLAVVFAWSGLAIVLLGWVTASAVFDAWKPNLNL